MVPDRPLSMAADQLLTRKQRYYTMSLKKSVLSHFFGSDSNTEPTSDLREDIATENREKNGNEAEPEKQNDEDSSSRSEASCLRLEADHPLNKLWRMWTENAPWLPAPVLRLAPPPGRPEILSPEETKKELSRLLFTVSSSANKRLLRVGSQNGEAGENHSCDMDAEAVVFMTYGNLTAWLLIYPPIGEGRGADSEMLEQTLRKSNVQFGVDEALLNDIPGKDDRYFHLYLIACGEPPVPGEDGYVVDMFSRSVTRQAKMNEFGKIDYTELNLIQNVNKGEAICRIVSPTPGQPGISVLNQPIPQRQGKPAVVPSGRNTELSEDGSCLRSTLTGRVEFNGRGFQVKPVLEIKGNIDYSTGNINFVGDVDIQGDICSGFNVKALGNITVKGVVEACKVEAGGDITLQKGVKGDMQAIIQSHRNIYAKYLESCTVYTRENLQSDCIINCTVYSDGSVHVDSGRGVIIGGKIRAARAVNARIVGSKAEGRTYIELGGMPSAEFEQECTRQEITELTSLLELLQMQPDSPAKQKGLPMVQSKISASISKLRQYDDTLRDLKIQEYAETNHEERLVCDTAYPGTEISIAGVSLTLHSETKYCTAALVDGEIKMI